MLNKLNAVQAFAVSVLVHEMPAVAVSTAIVCTIAVHCQQYVRTVAAARLALQRCRRHMSDASKQFFSS